MSAKYSTSWRSTKQSRPRNNKQSAAVNSSRRSQSKIRRSKILTLLSSKNKLPLQLKLKHHS